MMTQPAPTILGHRTVSPARIYRPQPVLVREHAQPVLPDLLGRFEPISLQQMDGVALLNRTDTKYMLHTRQLVRVLRALTAQYQILEIEGLRMHRYQTVYFDTADFELYRQHHAGGGNRYKVRSRKYVDSGLTCLEVKLKTNTDRTIKSRERTARLIMQMGQEGNVFLHEHLPLDPQLLHPRLRNDFVRITLVNTSAMERLTLDLRAALFMGEPHDCAAWHCDC